MSESTPPSSPEPITPEKSGGFFQNLVDVYFAPREAFGRIVARPAWVVPLLLVVVIMAVAMNYWVAQIEDPHELVKRQLTDFGVWEKMPEEAQAQALSGAASSLERQRWAGPLTVAAFTGLVFPAFFWVAYRFFYGGEIRFVQSVAIVSWSSLAVTLVTMPLNLIIMASRGDWYMNPAEALQANPTLFLDRAETSTFVWWLLTSLDLFSFWIMFLFALGFGVAIRKKTSSTIWAVAIPWAIFVVARAGLLSLIPGAR
jgi:hypothetical protein